METIPALREEGPSRRLADEYGLGTVHYLDAEMAACCAEGSIELAPGWVVVWLSRLALDGEHPVDSLAFPASRVVRIDFYAGGMTREE